MITRCDGCQARRVTGLVRGRRLCLPCQVRG